jgi:cytosine/adenosine deaminase-related metal-dependent hydrolase
VSAAPRAAAGGGRLAARCIVLDGERALAPGEIVWDGSGRIVRLARARRAEVDLCLLPALVDAHVHLQLEPLRARTPARDFVPWAEAVMAAQRATAPAERRQQARRALAALMQSGAAVFGEIDGSGDGPDVMARLRATGRCYRELTGFHLGARDSRSLVRERRARAHGAVSTGLSPHAPYSVSAELFAAARAATRYLSVHCAETVEEQEFLRHGRGPFRALLERLGRLPAAFRPPGMAAVRWLERCAVLGPGTLLVHCQELERGDVARIAAAGSPIVVCPGTIEWFGRTPPPVPRWLRAGIAVALGTDSRASNHGWSMRRELQLAARFWPELSPAELLALATTNGGRALCLPGPGRLRRGGRADFVAVRHDGPPQRLIEDFVQGRCRIDHVVAAGTRVRGSGPPRGAEGQRR